MSIRCVGRSTLESLIVHLVSVEESAIILPIIRCADSYAATSVGDSREQDEGHEQGDEREGGEEDFA